MYLSVEGRLPRSVARIPVEVRDPELLKDLTKPPQAELAIAKEIGFGASEYQWVKARVAEARLPGLSASVEGMARRMNEVALEGLEARLAESSDPEERTGLDAQIAELKRRLEEEPSGPPGYPTRQHNRSLLERHLRE